MKPILTVLLTTPLAISLYIILAMVSYHFACVYASDHIGNVFLRKEDMNAPDFVKTATLSCLVLMVIFTVLVAIMLVGAMWEFIIKPTWQQIEDAVKQDKIKTC